MEISRKSCRLCLQETEFNVSLFGSYCQKTNMIAKILVCLKLVIEETDFVKTICFKCAENVERYYDFTCFVKESQPKLSKNRYPEPTKRRLIEDPIPNMINRHHVKTYVKEQVYDADYTFSFLEMPEEKPKASSPFFSYFSPPNRMVKPSENQGRCWKDPRESKTEKQERFRKPSKPKDKPKHLSRDLFESQSQDVDDDEESKSLDWKVTPDENIIKRVREKCFGRSDF